jgi:transposase-like protein
MKKIPKREYTTEFNELAVKRVKDGQSVGAAVKELGLNVQTLRNWIKAANAGKPTKASGKVSAISHRDTLLHGVFCRHMGKKSFVRHA